MTTSVCHFSLVRHPLLLQMGVDLPALVMAASTDVPPEAANNQNSEIDSVRPVDIEEHASLHNR